VFLFKNKINSNMKNLKTFENYNVIDISSYQDFPVKKYGDEFPISNLSIGDRVTYLGAPYIVEESGDYVIILKSEKNESTIRVNQNMFNAKGFISGNNKPIKLR